MDNIEIEEVELEQIIEACELDCEPDKLLKAVNITRKLIEDQKTNKENKRQLSYGVTIEDIEAAVKQRDAIPAIKTGYLELDERVSFSIGTLSVIFAYSGHGKTSFMLQLMQKMMIYNNSNKYAYLYILCEQTLVDIREKFVKSWYEHFRGVNNGMSQQALDEMVKINFNIYANNKGYLIEKANTKPIVYIEDMESEFINPFQEQNKDKTIIVFVDYLQQVPTRTKKTGFEKVQYISSMLRDIAERQGKEIVIITGAQENKEGGLREADDIRQSATNIINLHNPRVSEADTDKGVKPKKLSEALEKFVKDKNNERYKPSVIVPQYVKTRLTHGVGEAENVFVYNGNGFSEYKSNGVSYTMITPALIEEEEKLKQEDIRTNAYGTGNVQTHIKKRY